MNFHLDGRDGQSQSSGYLFVGHFIQRSHQQCCAIRLRKRLEFLHDPLQLFFLCCLAVRIGFGTSQKLLHPLARFGLEFSLTRDSAKALKIQIASNCEEVALHCLQQNWAGRSPRAYKRLGHNIFRFGAVPRKIQCETIHIGRILFVQRIDIRQSNLSVRAGDEKLSAQSFRQLAWRLNSEQSRHDIRPGMPNHSCTQALAPERNEAE